jgi:hypothetical protein
VDRLLQCLEPRRERGLGDPFDSRSFGIAHRVDRAGTCLRQLFEYLLTEAAVQRKFVRAMRAGDRRVAIQQ